MSQSPSENGKEIQEFLPDNNKAENGILRDMWNRFVKERFIGKRVYEGSVY